MAQIEKSIGQVIASTRYGTHCSHYRLEIGWTWVAGAWQRP
jgi:hypothetical protein